LAPAERKMAGASIPIRRGTEISDADHPMTDEQQRIRSYLQAQGAKQTPPEIVAKVEAAMADLAKSARAVPAARFAERPEPRSGAPTRCWRTSSRPITYFGGGIVAILEGQPTQRGCGPRHRERASTNRRCVDRDLEGPAADALRSRASGRPGRAARREDRAPVLRPLELARDAAVHAAARLDHAGQLGKIAAAFGATPTTDRSRGTP